MALVLKTVDSCEQKSGSSKLLTVLQGSLTSSTYQQHQEKEALAKAKSSKGKDLVLMFGDKVDVFKRSQPVVDTPKDGKGHNSLMGKVYNPLGTPRAIESIATRFTFPVLKNTGAGRKPKDLYQPRANPTKEEETREKAEEWRFSPSPTGQKIRKRASDKEEGDKTLFQTYNKSFKSAGVGFRQTNASREEEDKADLRSMDKDGDVEDGDSDPEAAEQARQMKVLMDTYGKIDFYGGQEYLQKRKEKERQRNPRENSQSNSEQDKRKKVVNKKKKYRHRHHRLFCPFHPDNVVGKFKKQGGSASKYAFPISEIQKSHGRVAKASKGVSLIGSLEVGIDVEAVFQPLTVEGTRQKREANQYLTFGHQGHPQGMKVGIDVDEDAHTVASGDDMIRLSEVMMAMGTEQQGVDPGTSHGSSPEALGLTTEISHTTTDTSHAIFEAMTPHSATPANRDQLEKAFPNSDREGSDLPQTCSDNLGDMTPHGHTHVDKPFDLSSVHATSILTPSASENNMNVSKQSYFSPLIAPTEPPMWNPRFIPTEEDGECACTDRSTDSEEDRGAIDVSDFWRAKFYRMKYQMDKSLNDALVSRTLDREEVYQSQKYMTSMTQNATAAAKQWAKSRAQRAGIVHPKAKRREIRLRELEQLNVTMGGKDQKRNPLRRLPQNMPRPVDQRGNKPHDAVDIPLIDPTPTHPPMVWNSMWNSANREKRIENENMARCAQLYTDIIHFCDHIGYPNTAFQEAFVGHLRSELMTGKEVTQHLLFDLLLQFGRRSIESRDSMKLIQFLRENLGITVQQFFEWLASNNWKLTVELKSLKKRSGLTGLS